MTQAVFDLCVFDEVAFDEAGGLTITPSPASAIGSVIAPTVVEVPTAIQQVASNIEGTTARINGKISDDGGESCEARFRYRELGGTEEQTAYTQNEGMYASLRIREGQRLTISNRRVPELSFRLAKMGSPTGDVTFAIRKVSDDSIIVSKVWGDASALPPGASTWPEVTFDSPVLINEEVRLSCEFSGGDSSNCIQTYLNIPSVKEDEFLVLYVSFWEDRPTEDICYRYTYEYEWATTEWQNTLVTNDTYYADLTELAPVTEYEFQTQPKNSAGEGAWSASAYFKTALVIIPSPAQAVGSVVAPTVKLGSTTATPEHIDALAQVVQPQVKAGNIIYAPTPIDAIAKAISPSVIYGAIIPDPASAIASGANPIVILTSISITPTYIEAIGQVVAPIVSTTGGVIYVTPTPVDAIGGRVNPTVILGSISLTPSFISAIAEGQIGKVIQGNIIVQNGIAEAAGLVVAPTVIKGSLTLEPEYVKAIARGENPDIILASMTVTPEFVKALAGVIAPTVFETWIGRKLRIKIVTSQYRNLDVITSQSRNIDVVTAQKRKIRTLITGG